MKLTLRQKKILYVSIVALVLAALFAHAVFRDNRVEKIQTMSKTEVGIYEQE